MGKLDFSAHQVAKTQRLVFDLEPHGEGLAGSEILVDFFGGQIAAPSGIGLRPVLGDRLAAFGFQFLCAAEARVRLAFAQKLLGVLGVDIQAFRLPVGPVVADLRQGTVGVGVGAFLPVESQPAQVFNQLPFKAGFGPLHIGVLDAQHEIAPHAPGKEPVVEGCPRIAHVQHPRWRGSKANADPWVVHGSNDDRTPRAAWRVMLAEASQTLSARSILFIYE